MYAEDKIPEPFKFNPLKHHLEFMKLFVSGPVTGDTKDNPGSVIRQLKHIGSSIMDVYSGSLTVVDICREVSDFLKTGKIENCKDFTAWAGISVNDYRVATLSDGSGWTLKYHDDVRRYVHIFPARTSPHTFRVKANTLKSAILYYILIGKDYITGNDLNHARALLGLSPVRDPADAEAITEMIEMLRQQ